MTVHSETGELTDQTPAIEEREWFKKYTLVHFVQAAYTHGLIEQKDHIRIHTLPWEEKHVHVGKQRFWSEVFGPRYFGPRYFGPRYFDPRYLVRGISSKVWTLGIWSKVLVLSGFGPRY